MPTYTLGLPDGRKIQLEADAPETAQKRASEWASSNPKGQIEKGNIDLNSRPIVKNPDGTVSTVRSMSANFDGKEYLIPTVSDDGRVISDDEAIELFKKTGKHLGVFNRPDNATAYAERLHKSQERQYAPKRRLDNGPRVPQYATDASGQEVNLAAPEYQEAAKQSNAQYDAEKATEKKRLSNRGYGERALDAASFGLSTIPRALSRGEYGAGDIVGLASKSGGESVKRSEADFARANEDWLEPLADVGAASMGIPGLGQLGAPLRGMGATIAATRASPRGAIASGIRGAGETLEKYSRDPSAISGAQKGILALAAVNRAGRGLQSYADSIKPAMSRPKPNQPAMTGLPENIQTLPEKLADIQAFKDEGLQPFAPATGSVGTARGARTIEELPLIGGTVKSPKTNVELGFKERQQSLARDLGDRGTEESTGSMVQGALERYRTQGLEDLAPGTIRGSPVGPTGPQKPLGIEPYQPIKAAESMSAPAARRAADPDIAAARAAGGGGTAQTSRGATVSNARPLNQIGQRRTGVEDLSDAEVARLARAPSQQTSFATRAEALYESADRKIPELKRSDGSVNPNEIPTVNFGNSMRQTLREVGNQIAGQSTITGGLAKRIMNGNANFTYADLKGVRTEIGRKLGNFGQFDVGLDRGQLKRLYASATQDMEMGLRDIANRAWRDHRAGPKLPDGKPNLAYVDASVAKKADAALYEFRRADRYYRQGQARMDKFMQVLEAKTPNEAAKKITRALAENTANPQMLRSIMGVLRPEELRSLRGHIIASLGSGRPGAKASETIMSWHNWGTDFHKIMDNPAGREFMTKGLEPAIVKRLENLSRIANRMKYYEQTKNFSGSTYTGIIGAGAIAFTNPLAIPKLALATLGIAGMGKLLTSSSYLAWQEGLMRAQLKAGNTAASNARIIAQYAKRLPALAKLQNMRDPELGSLFKGLAVAIDEQMQGQDKPKALASPAPQQVSP